MNPTEALRTFSTLNDFIMEATEEEAKMLLDAEQKGQNRLSVLLRIHGRYNTLRCRRERIALFKDSNG